MRYLRVKDKWKRVSRKYWWGDELDVRFMAADMVARSAAGSFLDVGCGCGVILSLSRARLSVGVELSIGPLLEARGVAPMAELVLRDGSPLPFREESFELVAAIESLGSLRESLRIFAECLRVVAGTGRMLVVNINPEGHVYTRGRDGIIRPIEVEKMMRSAFEEVEFHFFNPLPNLLTRWAGSSIAHMPRSLAEPMHTFLIFLLLDRRPRRLGRTYIAVGRGRRERPPKGNEEVGHVFHVLHTDARSVADLPTWRVPDGLGPRAG